MLESSADYLRYFSPCHYPFFRSRLLSTFFSHVCSRCISMKEKEREDRSREKRGKRDGGGVLITEATVMPRPTTTTIKRMRIPATCVFSTTMNHPQQKKLICNPEKLIKQTKTEILKNILVT